MSLPKPTDNSMPFGMYVIIAGIMIFITSAILGQIGGIYTEDEINEFQIDNEEREKLKAISNFSDKLFYNGVPLGVIIFFIGAMVILEQKSKEDKQNNDFNSSKGALR